MGANMGKQLILMSQFLNVLNTFLMVILVFLGFIPLQQDFAGFDADGSGLAGIFHVFLRLNPVLL